MLEFSRRALRKVGAGRAVREESLAADDVDVVIRGVCVDENASAEFADEYTEYLCWDERKGFFERLVKQRIVQGIELQYLLKP